MVKFKNRYLLLEVITDDHVVTSKEQFNDSDVYFAMWEALSELHGDYGTGAAKQSLSVKVCNSATATVVARISRGSLEMLANSLCFVRKIGKHPAVIRTLHLGGSMRSCEKALLKIHRRRLLTSLPSAKTHQARRDIQQAIKASCGGQSEPDMPQSWPPDDD
uniref:Ribonuclease P/MRP protein subunit POP5 n=1 Tax=Plectus sambesii TaxID=2011161 RepID=A0A914XS61_9BILA